MNDEKVDVLISVRNQNEQFTERLGHVKQVVVSVCMQGTIEDVAHALANKIGVPQSYIMFIFCGNKLPEQTALQTLLLGPQTCLTAIVAAEKCQMPVDGDASCSASSNIASFQAFCKNCIAVKRAKLRVYCSVCSSSAVLVTQEPDCWNDVLQKNAIQVECKDCKNERGARFCFKCIDCGEVAVPLTHVRGPREGVCSVCYESQMKAVVQLNCEHQTCMECFTTYLKTAFTENQFRFFPQNGYTVGCPVYGCSGNIF
ncbi:unnamed protein product [Gongylonema pulchrum]|uniref:RBR-type E3 ubiquitin transferase n=1 Tax=Gongylonema pulchrum TaxID=637853 RepID=A0A183EHJ4_9BILA|nr:unnamed protein product [Gongylonema pulchrum]